MFAFSFKFWHQSLGSFQHCNYYCCCLLLSCVLLGINYSTVHYVLAHCELPFTWLARILCHFVFAPLYLSIFLHSAVVFLYYFIPLSSAWNITTLHDTDKCTKSVHCKGCTVICNQLNCLGLHACWMSPLYPVAVIQEIHAQTLEHLRLTAKCLSTCFRPNVLTSV